METEPDSGTIAKLRISNDHTDWQQWRAVQILLSCETVHATDVSGDKSVEAQEPQPQEGLETILEGSSETDLSSGTAPSDGTLPHS